ncbi:MAG: hypothetical protein RSH07_14945, partial [Comamonas sp.]
GREQILFDGKHRAILRATSLCADRPAKQCHGRCSASAAVSVPAQSKIYIKTTLSAYFYYIERYCF